MTPAHRRYLLVEALVSAGINAVLSIAFVLLVFGGQARIAADALVRDALAQSFAIALMATLVPTLLTARRLRTGALLPCGAGGRRRHPLLVALLTAVVVAVAASAVHWALLPLLLPRPVPFGAVLAGKAIYGALLGAGLTSVAVRRVLSA